MNRFFALFFMLFFSLPSLASTPSSSNTHLDSHQLYHEMQLENVIDYTAFNQAIQGYNKIDSKNKAIITLIDFSKPSTEDRLFVIDVQRKTLLYSSVVAHGRNSGGNYATSFSNEQGSYKSSLGFFITEKTYQGKNGYSLVLEGIEKGINDHAKQRAIVIHGATYAEPSFITSIGRLGRSLGCPALPQSISKAVIDTIKEGSLLYIYAADVSYQQNSQILA